MQINAISLSMINAISLLYLNYFSAKTFFFNLQNFNFEKFRLFVLVLEILNNFPTHATLRIYVIYIQVTVNLVKYDICAPLFRENKLNALPACLMST
jgi:hypothetical protein